MPDEDVVENPAGGTSQELAVLRARVVRLEEALAEERRHFEDQLRLGAGELRRATSHAARKQNQTAKKQATIGRLRRRNARLTRQRDAARARLELSSFDASRSVRLLARIVRGARSRRSAR